MMRPTLLLLCWTTVAAAAGGADPSTFTYAPLPAAGEITLRIDTDAPVFEFKSGPSHYAAFRLPTAPGRYLLDVVSYLDPPNNPARSRVMYPSLAFLSTDFLVTRTTDGPAWRFDLPEFGLTRHPAYRVTVGVEVSADPTSFDGEQYLVLFTGTTDGTEKLPGAADTGQMTVRVRAAP